jgi:hypothetical protein
MSSTQSNNASLFRGLGSGSLAKTLFILFEYTEITSYSNNRFMFSEPCQSYWPLDVKVLPPSTLKIWPVTLRAYSEVKKIIALATSSFWAILEF